ncbi:MAG: tRNA (adenosine(37)-N6)-threonylcarbamoyltransferase complex dimerization subunit type 1 TsaB [Dehalococcoidia bacterium]|nr:tRNA (adenosine(37)-N6)-threonylcarbamoyltransferase complex dimerization subunit type 1 TsaB [Dehalococcoidia bacterium]
MRVNRLGVSPLPPLDRARRRYCPSTCRRWSPARFRREAASAMVDGLLLAIDTSTKTASVALAGPAGLVAEYTWHAGMHHTRQLMPAIRAVLHENGAAAVDLAAIAIATGPGSFNGLRVGMATAKGLAYGLGIPLVAATTLEVAAYQHATASLPVCAVQDVGRGEIAWGVFQWPVGGEWSRLVTEHITTPEALAKAVKRRTLLCGEPRELLLAVLEAASGPTFMVCGPAASVRRAGHLAELGRRRLLAGETEDLQTLQPLYLRRPSITERKVSATLRL